MGHNSSHKNTRGSGIKDRGNRTPYVNPNPTRNVRGASVSGGSSNKPPTTAKPGAKPTSKTPKIEDALEGNKTEKVTASFRGKKRDKVNLRYPNKDIHKDTDYLEITILKYQPAGFTPQDKIIEQGVGRASDKTNGKKEILGTIKLPIPQNIKDLNATGWGEDSLNSAAAYAAAATGGIMFKEGGFIGNIIDSIKQTGTDIKNVAQDSTVQKGIQSQFTSATANLLGANTTASGLLSRAEGVILNPNKELLFNGVSLRDFSFAFDLAPRDSIEAEQIKQIIRVLKINMSPVTGDIKNSSGNITGKGLFLRSPNVFQLRYMTGGGEHKFLNKFKLMALTNISVNYTGSGTYMTYNDEDKTPVHMQMMLNFKELDPVYAEDYDTVGGVGY
jgi:hypothetical protein